LPKPPELQVVQAPRGRSGAIKSFHEPIAFGLLDALHTALGHGSAQAQLCLGGMNQATVHQCRETRGDPVVR